MCMKTELEQLKEQLNSISDKIKQLETPSFQKGWYKEKVENKLLVYFEDVKNLKGYGFTRDGEWKTNFYRAGDEDKFRPATDKEVEEALIKEAKRRGFKEGVKGIPAKGTYTFYNADTVCKDGWSYEKGDNVLYAAYDGNGGLPVFNNGIWADIISEPLKVCGYEVKKEGDDIDPLYSIGCKKVYKDELTIIKRVMLRNDFKTIKLDQYKVSLETINKILDL